MSATPLDEGLDHRLLEVLREGGRARDAGTGSPYGGHTLEHCLHAAGWVSRDLQLALEKASGGKYKAVPPMPREERPATDTGGPAFPADSFAEQHCPGMNLRQWYAGQALASVATLIIKGGADSNARPAEVTRTIASVCIEIADALIAAERAKVSP